MPELTGSTAPRLPAAGRGPGRVLVVVYAVFALSASARAGVQILTRFWEAPLAYGLSALAAAVYVLATVALVRPGATWRQVATLACSVELAGVLGIGALSLAVPQLFPEATVWSEFGRGYGYVPLVLPVLGLWWLRRTRPSRSRQPVTTN